MYAVGHVYWSRAISVRRMSLRTPTDISLSKKCVFTGCADDELTPSQVKLLFISENPSLVVREYGLDDGMMILLVEGVNLDHGLPEGVGRLG